MRRYVSVPIVTCGVPQLMTRYPRLPTAPMNIINDIHTSLSNCRLMYADDLQTHNMCFHERVKECKLRETW